MGKDGDGSNSVYVRFELGLCCLLKRGLIWGSLFQIAGWFSYKISSKNAFDCICRGSNHFLETSHMGPQGSANYITFSAKLLALSKAIGCHSSKYNGRQVP